MPKVAGATAIALAVMLRVGSAAAAAAGLVNSTVNMSGTCQIVGTRVGSSYTGQIETIVDEKGKLRRVGSLAMTSDAIGAALSSWLATLEEGLQKYGASPLEPPHEITIANVEMMHDRLVGYGRGDEGDSTIESPHFYVQVECTLKEADDPDTANTQIRSK